MRKLGNDVRCPRRDQEQVRAIRKIDVAGSPIFLFIVEARRHRIFGEGLQSEWRNEFGRVLCHDHKNFVALFDEETGQFG